jgi:hypothetical protein
MAMQQLLHISCPFLHSKQDKWDRSENIMCHGTLAKTDSHCSMAELADWFSSILLQVLCKPATFWMGTIFYLFFNIPFSFNFTREYHILEQSRSDYLLLFKCIVTTDRKDQQHSATVSN